jgi:hypothetical protein
MKLPSFTPWLPWDHRNSTSEFSGPGVYLLARFEEAPPTTVDTCDRRILLIAETHGQTLQRRWDQFHYSAFKGGESHAGGCTFHRLYCNGPDAATPPWLYVSAAAVPRNTDDVQGYVQSAKNQLLSEYQDRFGLLPCCNVRGPTESLGSGRAAGVGQVVESPDNPKTTEPVGQPPVVFGPWCPWQDRGSLVDVDAAGVYALACFDGTPPSDVDVLSEKTVYIGETCDNSLAGRMQQFHRSAFLGKDGHSGGWSFASRCSDQGPKLHVSVFPVFVLHEPHRSAFIRHTERRLLWEYVLNWGRRPICNSK